RIWYPNDNSKRPRLKRYLDETKGRLLDSVWTDVNPVNSQASERLNYRTQKPEALLERIIEASSNEEDLVLDCVCGSGTTAAVAEKLGRRWIGVRSWPLRDPHHAQATALDSQGPPVRRSEPWEVRASVMGGSGVRPEQRRESSRASARLYRVCPETHPSHSPTRLRVAAWRQSGLHGSRRRRRCACQRWRRSSNRGRVQTRRWHRQRRAQNQRRRCAGLGFCVRTERGRKATSCGGQHSDAIPTHSPGRDGQACGRAGRYPFLRIGGTLGRGHNEPAQRRPEAQGFCHSAGRCAGGGAQSR